MKKKGLVVIKDEKIGPLAMAQKKSGKARNGRP